MRFARIAIAIVITALAGSGFGRADDVIGLTDAEMDRLTAGSATAVISGQGSAVGSQAGTFTSALINGLEGLGGASAQGLALDGLTPSEAGIGTGFLLLASGTQGRIASSATGTGGELTTGDGSIAASLGISPERASGSGTTTVSAGGQKAVTVVETEIKIPGAQIGTRTTNEAEPSEEGVTLVSTTEFLVTLDRSPALIADRGAGTGRGGSALMPASGGTGVSAGTRGAGGSSMLRNVASQRGGGHWAGPAVCLSCR